MGMKLDKATERRVLEMAAAEPVKKPNKYGAVKTMIDGITFDSKKEAKRYGELRLMEQCGKISDLECHPRYELVVNGIRIGRYTADFAYLRKIDKVVVVEDVKSEATRKSEAYRLRKKLFEACYDRLTITEV